MPFDLKTLTWLANPVSREEARRIMERDHFHCQYCGMDGNASFENALLMGVDFVVPRARHGRKTGRNLVACCRPCNTVKGRRIFDSFDEAKSYVLARRAEMHSTWEHRMADQEKTSARAS